MDSLATNIASQNTIIANILNTVASLINFSNKNNYKRNEENLQGNNTQKTQPPLVNNNTQPSKAKKTGTYAYAAKEGKKQELTTVVNKQKKKLALHFNPGSSKIHREIVIHVAEQLH